MEYLLVLQHLLFRSRSQQRGEISQSGSDSEPNGSSEQRQRRLAHEREIGAI